MRVFSPFVLFHPPWIVTIMSNYEGYGDIYTPFYRWDDTSQSYAFDHDGFYATYGYYPSGGDSNSAAAYGGGYAQVAGYDEPSSSASLAAGSTAGHSGTSSQGGKDKKKWVPGPKDEQGNAIAGKLKRGETRTTVLRKAVGKVWEDRTLLEWDPSK